MNYQEKTRLVLDIVAIHCADSEMILAISAAIHARHNLVNGKTYISLAVDAACTEMQYIYDTVKSERTLICINLLPSPPYIVIQTERRRVRTKSSRKLVQHYNALAKQSFFYANHPKQDQCLRNLCYINIIYPTVKSTMFRQLVKKADERRCIRLSAESITDPNQQLIYFMKWGKYVLTHKAYRAYQYWFTYTEEQRAAMDKVIFDHWPE